MKVGNTSYRTRSVFAAFFFVAATVLFSCASPEEKKEPHPNAPKTVESRGYSVPADSITPPVVVPAVFPDPVLAGKPEIVSIDAAAHPGQDIFKTFREKLGLMNETAPFIGGEQALYRPRTIFEDKNGKLWFGTIGGASWYDGKKLVYFTEKEGLCNDVVNTILQDKKGNIWFGTGIGKISCYDGKTFLNFGRKEGLGGDAILCALEDKNGNIWFGSFDGVHRFDGKNFAHYSHKQGLADDDVTDMLEDKNGRLWFVSYNGGVSCFDGKSFTHFTEKEGLCSKYVTSVLEDKNGSIWFGTSGGGASCYNGKTFVTYTKKQGLDSDTIHAMLRDKMGNIWFGTEKGICKLSAKKVNALHAGAADFDKPLFLNYSPGLAVYTIYEDSKGTAWWGMGSWLVYGKK